MSDPTATIANMQTSIVIGCLLAGALGAALGALALFAYSRRRHGQSYQHGQSDVPSTSVTPDSVTASLTELSRRVDAVAHGQVAGQTQISEQLRTVASGNAELLRDTGRLAQALNHTGYRGRWGEAQLRRIVEAAGLTRGVHFTEQLHLVGDDTTSIPDMVITMSDDRTIVIDAKVPLDALLGDQGLPTDDARSVGVAESSQRHAAAVAAHIDQLSAKAYWRQFSHAPEFVVMFLPAESLLGDALTTDPALLERAFARNVVLATPTTLLALLRTVALGWRDRDIAENAEAIHKLGRELHDRLRVMNTHLTKLGSTLGAATENYNKLVGSYESRVLVSSRKMSELGVSHDSINSPGPIDRLIREPTGVALTTTTGP